MDAPCQGIARARGTTWTRTTQTTYREQGQKALPAWRSFPPSYTRPRNDGLSLKGTCWKSDFWPGSVAEASWFCVVAAAAAAVASRSVEKQRTQWDPGWEGQPSTHQSWIWCSQEDANITPHELNCQQVIPKEYQARHFISVTTYIPFET